MIEIIPIKYGKSVLSENMIFYDGLKQNLRPIVFMIYLIKTDNRTILVDAGCETMPGFEMQDFIGSINALKKFGVVAESVTDVIITHAHHDHIECVNYFKNATIHIEKCEYEDGKRFIPDGFQINVFSDCFTVAQNISVVKIGGHSVGSCVVEITMEDKIFVIAGDECYSRLCLTQQRHTGSFVNEEASKAFIQKYRDDKYQVLLCHEQ